MFDKKICTLFLDAELRNYNAGQGRHWGMTHAEKKRMQNAVLSAQLDIDGQLLPMREKWHGNQNKIFPLGKCDITVCRILGRGQRLWDADSVMRGNCKQLIDSIVDAGIIHDDGPKYVGLCLGLQDPSRREIGPAIEVTFWEASE